MIHFVLFIILFFNQSYIISIALIFLLNILTTIIMTNTSRVITVISTRGNKLNKYTMGQDLTWGDLKSVISGDYDLDGLKVVESVGKTTLELNDAKIPNGDVRIFMRPAKTKAGGLFSDLTYAELRAIVAEEGDALRSHLNGKASELGLNWTQLNAERLLEGIESYFVVQPSPEEERNTSDSPAELLYIQNFAGYLIEELKEVVEKLENLLGDVSTTSNTVDPEVSELMEEMGRIFGDQD